MLTKSGVEEDGGDGGAVDRGVEEAGGGIERGAWSRICSETAEEGTENLKLFHSTALELRVCLCVRACAYVGLCMCVCVCECVLLCIPCVFARVCSCACVCVCPCVCVGPCG